MYKITNDMFDSKKLLRKMDKEMLKRFGITGNMTKEVYDIEIEFTEMTGTFVKNQFWHPTQSFSQLPNGNYLMKLHCGINRELVGWIFQWMSNVKVRQPQILVDVVKDKYKEVLKSYDIDTEMVSNNTFRPK